jgi:hypothetical protein
MNERLQGSITSFISQSLLLSLELLATPATPPLVVRQASRPEAKVGKHPHHLIATWISSLLYSHHGALFDSLDQLMLTFSSG